MDSLYFSISLILPPQLAKASEGREIIVSKYSHNLSLINFGFVGLSKNDINLSMITIFHCLTSNELLISMFSISFLKGIEFKSGSSVCICQLVAPLTKLRSNQDCSRL
jgi:hypothetical protein